MIKYLDAFGNDRFTYQIISIAGASNVHQVLLYLKKKEITVRGLG